MKTFFNNVKLGHVAPDGGSATTFTLGAGTTDVNSSSVDRKGFESVGFLFIFGDNTDTGTFTAKLQHSSNNSDWTDCLDKDGNTITASFTAGASDTDHEFLGIEGTGTKLKRYVRIAIDRGTANTVIAAIISLLSHPHDAPVSQSTSAGQFISAPVVKLVNS